MLLDDNKVGVKLRMKITTRVKMNMRTRVRVGEDKDEDRREIVGCEDKSEDLGGPR